MKKRIYLHEQKTLQSLYSLQLGHKVVNHNSNYFDGPDARTYALRMCFIFIFGFFYQFCPSLSPALRRDLTSDFIIGTYSDLFAGVQVIIIPQLRPQYVYVCKWEVYDFAHDYRRKWCSTNLFIQYNNGCISGAMALLPEYSPSVSAPREESYYYISFRTSLSLFAGSHEKIIEFYDRQLRCIGRVGTGGSDVQLEPQ